MVFQGDVSIWHLLVPEITLYCNIVVDCPFFDLVAFSAHVEIYINSVLVEVDVRTYHPHLHHQYSMTESVFYSQQISTQNFFIHHFPNYPHIFLLKLNLVYILTAIIIM